MSIKTTYENYRVVIEPRRLGDFGHVSMSDSLICPDKDKRNKLYKEACQDIITEVKRHVDGVGYVEIDFDTVKECEHCGSVWTEVSTIYNGGCCEKDEENANSMR